MAVAWRGRTRAVTPQSRFRFLNLIHTYNQENLDAVPFLKPVTKTDAADYHLSTFGWVLVYWDVLLTGGRCLPIEISHPMDLQTMLKKTKAKQYKSKKEFKDDLDLIWFNCRQYNGEVSLPQHAVMPSANRNSGIRPCFESRTVTGQS